MCDIIISHCCFRFEFTDHLLAATLLQSESFAAFQKSFPVKTLKDTVTAYPFLEENKLLSEVSVIYCRMEFRQCCSAVALHQLLLDSNLAEAFSETVSLLEIIITIPMSSSEAERCFSTLKRVKNFLRNSRGEERLNALGMLSMEKNMIRQTSDFDKKVIDMFAHLKNRRASFLYKWFFSVLNISYNML